MRRQMICQPVACVLKNYYLSYTSDRITSDLGIVFIFILFIKYTFFCFKFRSNCFINAIQTEKFLVDFLCIQLEAIRLHTSIKTIASKGAFSWKSWNHEQGHFIYSYYTSFHSSFVQKVSQGEISEARSRIFKVRVALKLVLGLQMQASYCHQSYMHCIKVARRRNRIIVHLSAVNF